MCGRYVSASSPDAIAQWFGGAEVSEAARAGVLNPYNVAPTTKVPVVRQHGGVLTVESMRWGLVLGWAKSTKSVRPLINARAETAADKGVFRGALERRRCIVPADAFYEWTELASTGSAKAMKQPWHIARADGAPFAFAGLYEIWRDPRADVCSQDLLSFTILTMQANSNMARIHDRMPVTVPNQHWQTWLAPEKGGNALLAEIQDAQIAPLSIWPVSTEVNNSSHSGARLREPVEIQGQLL